MGFGENDHRCKVLFSSHHTKIHTINMIYHCWYWFQSPTESICQIPQYKYVFVLFLFYLFIYLFIYWLCWIYVAACRLSLVPASGGATLRCGARASHCRGFSCCRAWALGARASVVAARGLSSCGSQGLERRLSSWDTQA